MSNIIKKFVQDHKGGEITKQEGGLSLFTWGSACFGCYPPYTNKYYKNDFGSIVMLVKGNIGAGFFSFENYRKITREIFDKYLTNEPGKELNEVADFYNVKKETVELYGESDPEKIINIETAALVEKIKKAFLLIFKWEATTLFAEALDENIVRDFYEKLAGGSKGFDVFLKTSSLSGFKSFVSRSDEALLNFDDKPVYDIQWILGNYSMTVPLKRAELQIKNIISARGGYVGIAKGESRLAKQIGLNKNRIDKFRASLSGDLVKLFDFIQLCIYIRDIRKDDALKQTTILSNCLRELYVRLGLKEDDFIFAFYPDFANNIYKNKDYKSTIEKRKKGFIAYFNKGIIETEYGEGSKLLKELYKVMDESFSSHKKSEIRGNVGCRGYAKALASIVLSEKDFFKFKKGNVLVTSMTRPEYIPLMKKASGVITDEGGVTSHAAIISREMGIPCIIGTKNATRILKDGDLVEVDANKGVVKILK